MSKEYIERVALIDKMSKLKTGGIFTEVFKKVVLEIISNQPTADVQEVRHGKWIYVDGDLGWADCKCSECGYTDTDSFEDCTECFYNFCPNCGAKMDEE